LLYRIPDFVVFVTFLASNLIDNARLSMTDTPSNEVKKLQLSAIEARILGCLVEKEATTPDTYPLTTNAIVQASNQKTARDPLMSLELGNVANALRHMEVAGLVRSQHTARSERYEHRLNTALSLTQQQTAVVALLMLRGPQTAYELFARSDRLAKFESAEDVQHTLERLTQKSPALVTQLPRGHGQRGDRYMHTLCGEIDLSIYASDEASMPAAEKSSLLSRVEQLEERIAQLEARLSFSSNQNSSGS
jgi:uncharacterized protein